MADVELVIKIPEELYELYKGRPPMLGDAGMDMIAQSIANGTPLETKTRKSPQRTRHSKDDDWSGAQGNGISKVHEEQERGSWGIYG